MFRYFILTATALLLMGCNVTFSSGTEEQQRSVAQQYEERQRAAVAAPVLFELGWEETIRNSRDNLICWRVVRNLGYWRDAVCRQRYVPGIGQVIFVMTSRQKDFLRAGGRLDFTHRFVDIMLPVYAAERPRHRHYHYWGY